jgi:hypothetical protein
VNLEEIRDTLVSALKLRVPAIDPDERPAQRIDKMESYANLTAIKRGELEEALFWLSEARKPLQREWDEIDGWQATIPKHSDRTQERVRQAKRTIKPDLYDALAECHELQSHLHRQIRRLERDADWMSREYTFLSGK